MKHYLRIEAILVVAVVFVQGCAIPYKGEVPRFHLSEESAKEEIKKFSFREEYMSQGEWFAMGTDSTLYTIESLEPIIRKVSPSAFERLSGSKKLRTIELALLGASFVSLVMVASTADVGARQNWYNITDLLLLGSVGFGLVYYYQLYETAGEYNKDLRRKLTPGVALNLTY